MIHHLFFQSHFFGAAKWDVKHTNTKACHKWCRARSQSVSVCKKLYRINFPPSLKRSDAKTPVQEKWNEQKLKTIFSVRQYSDYMLRWVNRGSRVKFSLSALDSALNPSMRSSELGGGGGSSRCHPELDSPALLLRSYWQTTRSGARPAVPNRRLILLTL